MIYHDDLTPLNGNRDVLVKWSRAPAGKAILFVHGFNGHKTGTWTEFDSFLSDKAEAAAYDLIFYGYDGLGGTTYPLTIGLLSFLEQIHNQPDSLKTVVPPSIMTAARKPYSHILVVAHSLGAVLARWALAIAINQGDAWTTNTQLALFAPAHNGARPGQLIRLVTGGMTFLRFFSTAVLYRSPLIDELEPTSNMMQRFSEDVKKALKKPAGANLTPCLVVHANRERVVFNLPFENDPLPAFPELFHNANHTSVCKPTRIFDAPLMAIGSLLR